MTTTEAQQPDTTTTGEVKTEPKVVAPVEPKVEASPAPASAKPAASRKLADDDEIPETDDLIELSPRALKNRLTRHTSAELKAAFGTSDMKEIKAKLDRLTDHEAKAEAARRASLDEQTKLKEDLAKERSRATAAEERATAVEENRIFEKQDTQLTKIAEKFIDPDYIDVELTRFAKHLMEEYSESELAKLKPSQIEKWFEERVAEKPKLSKDYGTETAPAAKTPLTNGAQSGGRPGQSNSTQMSTKTFAPGKANSMTSAEARAEARKQGLNW